MTTSGDLAVPTLAPDLVVRDLADGTLVFDPQRLRAHALNPSAAAILRSCDGTRDAATIAADLRADVGPDAPADLAAQVAHALQQLRAEGVLVGGEPTDDAGALPSRRKFLNVPHTGDPAPEGPRPTHTSVVYRGLDFAFRVTTGDADLATYLDAILAPLAVADVDGTSTDELGAPDLPVHTYDVRTGVDPASVHGPEDPEPDTGLIALDGYVVSTGGRSRQVAAALLWHINQMVSTTSDRFLQLHASAVVRNGRALVLPASMNSGKSTLVAGLVSAGAAYVTDETVAIDPATRRVIPYPKAIALDPGSWPLLPHLAPRARPEHARFEHDKWHVTPSSAGAVVAGPAPVGLIVFPTHRQDRPTSLTEIGATDAAVELCQNAFNLDTIGTTGIDLITELAASTRCYRLTTADLPSALDVLHDLLDRVEATR